MSLEPPVKFAVYDVRAYFAWQPGDLRCCPACGSSLSRSDIEPSTVVSRDLADWGLIPRHDYSYLYECTACLWWAVRESWSWCETMLDMDYLIVGEATGTATLPRDAARRDLLREQVLNNDEIYKRPLRLPDKLGQLFIGGKRA